MSSAPAEDRPLAVLVIDDERPALDELTFLLEHDERVAEVHSTDSPTEALRLLRQAASAGTVAQSIQRILLVTEQTGEGTQQTAGSIRQLSELAQELKGSVSRFKVH